MGAYYRYTIPRYAARLYKPCLQIKSLAQVPAFAYTRGMETARPRIPRNVLVLGLVALASGFGQDLITPVLPGFLALIGVSHAVVGLIDGLLQGTTSVFRFISGVLSDKFHNRKWFVFAGYALSSIARPLLALSTHVWPVAALRLADGAGKGMKDAPRDALVADSSQAERRGRAFGAHRLLDTAGSVFGPLLAAGLLLSFTPSLETFRLIFALAALPGLAALVLIFFGIREPRKTAQAAMAPKQNLSWQFWVFTLAVAVALLTRMNDSLFLLRTQEIGVSAGYIPLVFAGFTLIYALLSYPVGIWSDKIGRLPLIAAGWAVMTAVEVGFSQFSSVPASLILLSGYGVMLALTEGPSRAFIADLVPGGKRGAAYGIFNTVAGVSLIIGGFGLGRIWDTVSASSAFGISAVGSAFAAVLFLILSVKNNISH